MPDVAADRVQLARNSARNFAGMCTAVALIAVVSWTITGGITLWQWYIALATVACGLLIMHLNPKPPVAASVAVFLVCAFVSVGASVISNDELVRSDVRFEAFAGFKLLAIAVAVIAPIPAWLGYGLIAVCSIGPVLQYAALPAAIQRHFAMQEPWYALVYAVMAFLILRHRLHAIAMERALSRMQAERQAMGGFAKVFLGLRDLTNSPLQSVELTSRLLQAGILGPEEASKHLEASLVRLRKLSAVLTTYEENIDWLTTEASFDAADKLKESQQSLQATGRTE